MGLGGCRHKPQLAPLPPVQSPVELEDIPPLAEDKLPMVEVPQIRLPPTPVASAAARRMRERRRPAKVAAAPPPVPETAPAVSEPSPQEAAIGALTAGGDANPQAKQEAGDLLISIEKRLNGLPAQMTDEQKTQVSKVRNFWRDAQQALKSGDAEGAKTLATKAKLLLDDMEK
jgi:ribosomal protein S20